MQFRFNKSILLVGIVLTVFMVSTNSSHGITFKKKHKNVHDQSENYYPWGIQLSFEGDMEDDDVGGIRFSLTKQYDKHTSVRFNLGVEGVNRSYTQKEIFYNDGTSEILESGNDFDATGGYLSLQFLHHPNPNRGASFFWGIGPRLSVREADFEYAEIYDNGFYYEIDNDNSAYLGLGLEGTLGFEFFLGQQFSLLAEYGAVLQNEWLMYEVDYINHRGDIITEVESINEGWDFDGKRLRLGAAFYF